PVGLPALPQRLRPHRRADHALHGGGRGAVRSRRDPRPRPTARPRLAGRARAGPGRPDPDQPRSGGHRPRRRAGDPRRRGSDRRRGAAHRDAPPARGGTGGARAPRRSARAERLGRLTGGRVLAPDRTGVPLVKPLVSLSRAMFLGFFRDRMTLFWAVLFPLMFLVLFGGIFSDQTAAKIEIAQVGP